jgi:type II secretory pathway pseudopilin PulG
VTRRGPAPGGSKDPESGHLLLVVMLGAAVQQWSAVQRRENEEELIFRGKQYVRAIKLYQAEHGGALPTSLEILVKPGPRRLRYIRKLFRDPMAPDGKWGILLAHPSGRGYINPNAPPPTEGEGVPGLEDLGTGLKSGSQDEFQEYKSRKTSRGKSSGFQSGNALGLPTSGDTAIGDAAGKESVTAPGQPLGPIVGVVSLADQTSFRLFREHENYTEWAFNIFEDGDQGQNQQQQARTPVATPGVGVGPGGQQTIWGGGNCIGKDCPTGTTGGQSGRVPRVPGKAP